MQLYASITSELLWNREFPMKIICTSFPSSKNMVALSKCQIMKQREKNFVWRDAWLIFRYLIDTCVYKFVKLSDCWLSTACVRYFFLPRDFDFLEVVAFGVGVGKTSSSDAHWSKLQAPFTETINVLFNRLQEYWKQKFSADKTYHREGWLKKASRILYF